MTLPIDPNDPYVRAVSAWAWDTFGKDIVGGIWGKLTGVANSAWEKFDWRQASKAYLEKMRTLHGTVRLLGKSEPVSLDGIFTDVMLLDKLSAERYLNFNDLMREPDHYDHGITRIDALNFFKSPINLRLLILGKPGAGKTTFLKHLVQLAVQGKLPQTPIYISLNQWANSDHNLSQDGLLAFMAEQFDICSFPDATSFLKLLLLKGRALVLLDGLDEVNQADDQRQHTIQAISNFTDKYLKVQCVMTCRTAASDYTFSNFRYAEVADFTPEQVRVFVDKWFRYDVRTRDRFYTDFHQPDNKGLRDLANRPILLSLICLAFEETLSFPANRRVELYKQAIDTLLKRWDSTRGIKRDEFYRGLTLGRKETMFTQIAATLFDEGLYFVKQVELVKHIDTFLSSLPNFEKLGAMTDGMDGNSVIDAVESQHGIWVERVRDIYSFSHLSLQEYFAAQFVVQNASDGALLRLLEPEHLVDDRWREVIMNTAGILNRADHFFETFLASLRRPLTYTGNETVRAYLSWAESMATNWQARDTGESLTPWYILAGLNSVDRTIDLPFVHDLGQALDRSVMRDLHRDLDLARSHDPVMARAIALSADLDRAISVAFGRAFDTALARALATVRAFHHPLDNVAILDLLLQRLVSHSDWLAAFKNNQRDLVSSVFTELLSQIGLLAKRLNLIEFELELREFVPPAPSDNNLVWHEYSTRARDLAQRHRNMGFNWQFTADQLNSLANFLVGTKLMLECLDVAVVSPKTRNEVKAGAFEVNL